MRSTTIGLWGLTGFGTLAACNDKHPDDASTCRPVRSPTGTVVPGDADTDGVADLVDVVLVRDHLFASGAEPACLAAAEVSGDHVEGADLWGILAWAYAGTTILDDATESCTIAGAAEDVCVGALELVPVPAARTAMITLRGLTRADAVQGWSFGVETEGCTLASATTTGTSGALTIDGGLRHGGYDHTEVLGGKALTAVLLDNFAPRGLSSGDHALLALSFTAPTSCGPCTVHVVDGLVGSGQPVSAMVAAEGRAVVPALGEATFELCP